MTSTKQVYDVEISELPTLTPEDLTHFAEESVKLVLEYQLHGWTGRLSGNQHVIMRAPDGDGTASIQRKYRNKRSGDVQRRPLNQWLARRRRRKEAEQEAANAFGLTDKDLSPSTNHEVSDGKPPWLVAKKQSYDALLRLQKRTRDWWEDALLAPYGDIVYMFLEDGPDDWALMAASRTDLTMRMIAVGPAAQPADIEQITIDMERLNERNRADKERSDHSKENESMNESGPQTKKKYPCEEPGCDRSFDLPGARALHAESHVPGGFPCPLCDRVPNSSSARGSHLRSKEHADDPRLPAALKMLSKGKSDKASVGGRYKRMPPRPCEYCEVVMAAASIGGHQRGHKKLDHIKIADGGDGATQVIGKAKAITAPEDPIETPEAVTEAPVKPEPAPEPTPEPLVVEAIPAAAYVPAVLNGTGTGEPPEVLLDRVRALVSPKMVGDLERARVRNRELETELEQAYVRIQGLATDLESMTEDRNELQAMFDMIEERRKRVSDRA